MKRFVTEKIVAEMTSLSLSTLRNHRFRGVGIPYVKIGRSVRYNLQDVTRFMESNSKLTLD